MKDRQSSRADARGLGMSGHGIVKLLGRSRKMGDEEIEIALSGLSFPSRGDQLRCALVFPLSVELARR